MSNYIQRLKEEKKELSKKLESLREFIESENFTKINPVQMTLLNIQIKAMETYSQCLLERLIRLDAE